MFCFHRSHIWLALQKKGLIADPNSTYLEYGSSTYDITIIAKHMFDWWLLTIQVAMKLE